MVDDEPKIVEVVGDYLRNAGFAVTTAADGEGALASARARPPDLVVLDLGLPGLDGLDVARELRRLTSADHHAHGEAGGDRPRAGVGARR